MSAIEKKSTNSLGFPKLPDTRDWTNRFTVESSSSDEKYLIAQHKTKRHWACSCAGWRIHRRCKHLQKLGIPCGKHLPAYEPKRMT